MRKRRAFQALFRDLISSRVLTVTERDRLARVFSTESPVCPAHSKACPPCERASTKFEDALLASFGSQECDVKSLVDARLSEADFETRTAFLSESADVLFDSLDLDNNGKVTPNELRAILFDGAIVESAVERVAELHDEISKQEFREWALGDHGEDEEELPADCPKRDGT